jgi:NAD(P)-dependent dehydrogenase (short-subunit alcohol dehydrogenase family)
MSGTIIITGANGSLATPAVKYLLEKYPYYTAILTVRNTSQSDANTAKLREIITQFPKAKTSIRKLDLSSLAEVKTFADAIANDIASKKLENIAAIVCNAYIWSINDGLKFSAEGYELSLAVNHLAHLSLVLRLLGELKKDGRIVFLGSDAHQPGKNGLEKYPPGLPEDLDALARPKPDVKGQEVGRGLQRYGNSKLAVVMGTYELNRRLLQVSHLY